MDWAVEKSEAEESGRKQERIPTRKIGAMGHPKTP